VAPQLAVHPVVPAVHPVVPGVQVAQLAVQPEPMDMEVAGVQVAQLVLPMVVLALAMLALTQPMELPKEAVPILVPTQPVNTTIPTP
jgi:hypothetical protein